MTIAVSQNPPLRADGGASFIRRRLESPLALASAVFVASLAWTLFIRLPLFRAYGTDDAGYVEVAHLWMRGVLPYAGVFDVKPPGLFALLAAAETVFGPTLEALRAVAVFSDAVAATALFLLARRFGDPRIGLFAAVLYPVLSLVAIGYDAYCPLVALTALAFLAALSPLSLIRRAALAGLAIGAAGAVKQTAGFEALALLAILVGAPDGARRRGRAALAYALGLAVAPLGFLTLARLDQRPRPGVHLARRQFAQDFLRALLAPALIGHGLAESAMLELLRNGLRFLLRLFGQAESCPRALALGFNNNGFGPAMAEVLTDMALIDRPFHVQRHGRPSARCLGVRFFGFAHSLPWRRGLPVASPVQ